MKRSSGSAATPYSICPREPANTGAQMRRKYPAGPPTLTRLWRAGVFGSSRRYGVRRCAGVPRGRGTRSAGGAGAMPSKRLMWHSLRPFAVCALPPAVRYGCSAGVDGDVAVSRRLLILRTLGSRRPWLSPLVRLLALPAGSVCADGWGAPMVVRVDRPARSVRRRSREALAGGSPARSVRGTSREALAGVSPACSVRGIEP